MIALPPSVTVGVAIGVALLAGGSGGSPGSSPGGVNARASGGTYTASGPWRLKVADHIGPNDNGCSITLIDAHGSQVLRYDSLYGQSVFQVHQTRSFRWQATSGCLTAALPGSGTATLPFATDQIGAGDTDVFAAPGRVAVQVTDWHGDQSCDFQLYDPAGGSEVDFVTATRGHNNVVTLNPSGHRQVYLHLESCGIHVSAG